MRTGLAIVSVLVFVMIGVIVAGMGNAIAAPMCPPTPQPTAPTAVLIVRLEGWPEAPAIHIQWETGSEIDNLGFNVYRSNTYLGVKAKLNDALIPSLVPPGSGLGAVYDYVDARVKPARTYWYWLEDVDIYGVATMNDPIRVVNP